MLFHLNTTLSVLSRTLASVVLSISIVYIELELSKDWGGGSGDKSTSVDFWSRRHSMVSILLMSGAIWPYPSSHYKMN